MPRRSNPNICVSSRANAETLCQYLFVEKKNLRFMFIIYKFFLFAIHVLHSTRSYWSLKFYPPSVYRTMWLVHSFGSCLLVYSIKCHRLWTYYFFSGHLTITLSHIRDTTSCDLCCDCHLRQVVFLSLVFSQKNFIYDQFVRKSSLSLLPWQQLELTWQNK